MKSKKGFLLAEEAIKLVIAFICVCFLAYFLFSLYYTNKDSKDLEFAGTSLNYLISEINLKNENIEIYNPSSTGVKSIFWDWKLTSWDSSAVKPKQCSSLDWENCLCICEDNYFKNNAEECDKKGVCLEINKQVEVSNNLIEIEEVPLFLEIKYGDKIIINKK